MSDVIDQYAKKGGPLPSRGNSAGSAFWRAYAFGPDQTGLRGGAPGSVADRMFKAGLRRRKAEPDLKQLTRVPATPQ